LMDAARFLPVFGLVLLLLPLMRGTSGEDGPPTATETVYLFAVWIALILVAFFMSLGLRRTLDLPKSATSVDQEVPEPTSAQAGEG
jgi:hypothetical protein